MWLADLPGGHRARPLSKELESEQLDLLAMLAGARSPSPAHRSPLSVRRPPPPPFPPCTKRRGRGAGGSRPPPGGARAVRFCKPENRPNPPAGGGCADKALCRGLPDRAQAAGAPPAGARVVDDSPCPPGH